MTLEIRSLAMLCLIGLMKLYKYEHNLLRNGHKYIVGCDEVGRGPLAGPVVASAVILDPEYLIEGLDDSKKLSEKKRTKLYDEILEHCLAYETVYIYPEEIDKINIYQASKKAMMEAIKKLSITPTFVLSDAMPLEGLGIPFESIIKGDQTSASIAAASIVAKVSRDSYMVKLASEFPEYGFDKHKGYPTKAHKEALVKHGITPYHRKSYAPVQQVINVQQKLNIK